MWARVAALALALLLAQPLVTHAEAPVGDPAVPTTNAVTATVGKATLLTDSLAKRFIQSLPTDKNQPIAKNAPSVVEYTNPRAPIRLDEITVYGQVEPEDYVRRRNKMQEFRARLENDRRMTPKEKAQLALCLLGFCGLYGPEGIPLEGTAADRTEARVMQSTTQLNGVARGTLQ